MNEKIRILIYGYREDGDIEKVGDKIWNAVKGTKFEGQIAITGIPSLGIKSKPYVSVSRLDLYLKEILEKILDIEVEGPG